MHAAHRDEMMGKGRPKPEGRQHRFCSHFQLFSFCLLQSFRRGPLVLEPDFDLGLCEVWSPGQLCPLYNGEVLLPVEFSLQSKRLGRRKGYSRLLMGLVLLEGAGGGSPVFWPRGVSARFLHAGGPISEFSDLTEAVSKGLPRGRVG